MRVAIPELFVSFVLCSMCGYDSPATIKTLTSDSITVVESEAIKIVGRINRFSVDRNIKITASETTKLLQLILGPDFSSSSVNFKFRPGDKALILTVVELVHQTLDTDGYIGFNRNHDQSANCTKTKIGLLFANEGNSCIINLD